MSVGLGPLVHFFALDGLRIATGATGSRYKDRDDLVLFSFPPGTTHAACFTQNAFAAAPVHIARSHMAQTSPKHWLINAGNANAATGEQGLHNARRLCDMVANTFACTTEEVLPFSTGVIGEQLPVNGSNNPFAQTITALELLDADNDQWRKAAHAIMTTDTCAKGVSVRIPLGDSSFGINAIAKGSGMICPNMATMLAFIVTDLQAQQTTLHRALTECLASSFHAISVDGDTSTNDAVALAALGTNRLGAIENSPKLSRTFHTQLQGVCDALAQLIVRDGEGATKLVCIEVTQAQDSSEAQAVARQIAHSPLVKTALFASDPNWGRIACAIGNAPIADCDPNIVDIWIDDLCIMRNGQRDSGYTEEQGQRLFAASEIWIRVVLKRGEARSILYTTDLSHEYVSINASYRS